MNFPNQIKANVLSTRYSAGQLDSEIKAELTQWENQNKVQRLWSADATLWTNTDENKWTGWLNLVKHKEDIHRIVVLASELQNLHATDIVVLGMGGSSLCPAMFAKIFGKIDHYPRLHVLDSTDPMQIDYLDKSIDLMHSFFIVSSKSGTTLEPNIFKDYFYSKLQKKLNKKNVGERFIAITDPHTELDLLAKKENFRDIFYGVPSVGGRYSALSNFGMVPFGLMGGDSERFLSYAEIMQEACLPRVLAENNPAVVLGVVLGVCARQRRDKVTLIVSPSIFSLGAWLEQLLAESTGKEGKGMIPIDQEPLGSPDVYGQDRVFAYIRLDSEPDPMQDKIIDQLDEAGFIVLRLHVQDKMHLGMELFRWEMATAVAGSIIGINPFNQPDVEASKKLALEFTTQYEKTGQFIQPSPSFSSEGLELFSSVNISSRTNIANYLYAFLQLSEKNGFIDFSAFIPMTDKHIFLLQKIRTLIRDKTKLATCLGFGPRFLHSTGQDYKGGPNIGLFIQITADHEFDIPVSGHHYTFGFVITAQAQADFTVMKDRARKILRIHLGKNCEDNLNKLYELMVSIYYF